AIQSTSWNWAASAPFNLPAPQPPAPPTGFTSVGQTFASVRLQWTDNASNEVGYEIVRSTTGLGGPFTPLATTSANATSYVDQGLTENTSYCYQIRAVNFAGNSNFVAAPCATTPPE